MRLEEIKKSDKVFLTPKDIAEVLESDPQTVRETAVQKPELLGFKYCFLGNRMKIPRKPFLEWLGEAEETTD